MIIEKNESLDLTCSIVLYKTDRSELLNAISCVLNANLKVKIFLIDNSPTNKLASVLDNDERVEYIFNNKNLGYGAAHNVAIRLSKDLSKYHLILNADVEFDPAILNKAFLLLEHNKSVSLVSPKVVSPDGKHLPFCRLLPTPFDLFARRFLPAFMKDFLVKKLNNYLMLFSGYDEPMNIPNLPGCFMFVRTEMLNRLGGFDEKFFMYVEDVDLTRRIYQNSKCIYYPDIQITHGLARGSAKLSILMMYHIKSAIYYFNKWGWFIDKERKMVNKHLIATYDDFSDSSHKNFGLRPVLEPIPELPIEQKAKIDYSGNVEKIRLGAVDVVTQSHYI